MLIDIIYKFVLFFFFFLIEHSKGASMTHVQKLYENSASAAM